MQRTTAHLSILVGEDRYPIKLTDSAVEAVQGEAAGVLVTALANVWTVEQTVQSGEGFASLDLNALIELRQALQSAGEAADVLIECRPLDEAQGEDDG